MFRSGFFYCKGATVMVLRLFCFTDTIRSLKKDLNKKGGEQDGEKNT